MSMLWALFLRWRQKTGNHMLAAGREISSYNHFFSRIEQVLVYVTPEEPGSTGYGYSHLASALTGVGDLS
jgi:hypothetical protein